MNPYDVLNVDKNASTDEVKKAYKNKSKETHPDKKGGSHEEFIEVKEAFLILSDPVRRDKFDRTGSTEPEDSFDRKFMGFINDVFMKFVDHPAAEKIDLMEELRDHIDQIKNNLRKNISDFERDVMRFQKIRDRITTKGNNIIIQAVENKIEHAKSSITIQKETIVFLEQVEVVLDDYEYNFDDEDDFGDLPKREFFITSPGNGL